ncbi:MAG TPA: phospholipase D-like domain-containing protein [Mesotoga sp.]|nr:phospholipase D-like domain-containing protein [Mesotoga sp.]HOI34574.1 phospholipase D-like domain-containing protein [Mesotoga infera]MDD4477975.1 phospholipase D-like domain-containing protein [Mesotoga sp.]MDD5743108.1 phospholipase D-like domain-containing protein [Mesotoga sp.]HOY26530.1 phospholipase D-like domain-containing protein [Mesotoga sp.]
MSGLKGTFIALVLLINAAVLSVVFFTDDGTAVERIVELLESAGREVILVSYSLDDREVMESLERLGARGVDIKIMIDDSTVGRALGELTTLEMLTDSTQALIHSKFILVDRERVLFGTGNFTQGSLREDSNSFIQIDSKELAGIFVDFYEAIISGESREPKRFENMEFYLCPSEKAKERVISELMKARHEISFAMFAFTDPSVLSALKFKASRGVRVSGVLDSWNLSSPLEDFLSTGMEVIWGDASFTIHDKTFVIDGRKVITGSANATLSGWGKNREIVAIIDSEGLSRQYREHIEYLKGGGVR